MKLKQHIILFAVLFGLTTLLSAQSPEVQKAKEILDRVSAKTKTYTSIRAEFAFTLENLQAQMTDTHEGTIIIKGDKYKIDIMGVDTYFNGTTVWMHLKEVNEVNITGPEMVEEETLSPATIFSIYEEGYKYLYAGEATMNGKKVDIIDLFPEERNKPFSRIQLFIYRDNLHFAQIKQMGKDGNNYIIDVKKMETNITAPDSLFTFEASKHPGIEIIDLR
jgi:outer membrane lipoprotein-sorting protein